VSEAVRTTCAQAEDELRGLDSVEALTHRALDILGSRRNDAYGAALAELQEDTQEWWADTLKLKLDEREEDEEPATADVDGLRRFIESKVLPWFEDRRKEIANRPLIREQFRQGTKTSSSRLRRSKLGAVTPYDQRSGQARPQRAGMSYGPSSTSFAKGTR
jgi:hypothetical protein